MSLKPALYHLLPLLFFCTFAFPPSAKAACPTGTDNTSITTASDEVCTLNPLNDAITYYGVDTATDEGATNTSTITIGGALGRPSILTINNKVVFNVRQLNISGGTIAIQAGGIIKVGTTNPLYVTDADADGWAANFTIYNASASGRRRLGLMRSTTVTDCNDSIYIANNVCCFNDGLSCTSDGNCCSGICGTDADSDNFFSESLGHTGTCQATTKPYTDCYDSNANAKPGQTTCYTTNRGDGSFDYNCSGANDYCTSYGAPAQWYVQGRCCGANGTSCCGDCASYCLGVSGTAPCGTGGYVPGSVLSCGSCGGISRAVRGAAGTQSCR